MDMEGLNDRKRVNEEESDGFATKKAKALNSLSEGGPLTQQDVVYFKKEAIWRQMKSYKHKSLMLEKSLNEVRRKYEANEEKLNILDGWYQQIVQLIGDLAAEQESELRETLLIKLTNVGSSDIDAALQRRREQLVKLLQPLLERGTSVKGQFTDFEKQVESLNYEVARLNSSNTTLSKIKTELEAEVDELKNQVLRLLKDSERQKSKTLHRVDESLSNGKDDIKESPDEGESAIKEENNSEGSEAIDNEEFEKLTIEVNELQEENKELKNKVNEMNSKCNVLDQEYFKLKDNLENLTENDLQKSPLYKELVATNKSLNESIDSLKKINGTTINKLSEMEANRDNLKELLDKLLCEENESLKQQLSKCENDLARIRAARDELLSKQTILKSQIENQTTNEQLHKLNQTLNDRIKGLEEAKAEQRENEKLNELSKEELIKRVSMLDVEIKEIEKIFQETKEVSLAKLSTAVEHENLSKKLSIEKTKADQKYFASMRYKDALSAENKVLKTQVSKSQELVNKLTELEKSYTNKILVLTKANEDFRAIKESSVHENSRLQDSIKVLKMKASSLELEVGKLKASVAAKSTECSNATSDLESSKLTVAKLERKLKSTESLLKKYKSKNTSSILQEDEKQLEALRTIAKCSVCSKNWKDTVLTVCGHVFCQGCTQERLAARLRRCPTCNKGFSANDLLSIHL